MDEKIKKNFSVHEWTGCLIDYFSENNKKQGEFVSVALMAYLSLDERGRVGCKKLFAQMELDVDYSQLDPSDHNAIMELFGRIKKSQDLMHSAVDDTVAALAKKKRRKRRSS